MSFNEERLNLNVVSFPRVTRKQRCVAGEFNWLQLPQLPHIVMPRDRNRAQLPWCLGEPAHEIGHLAELREPTHFKPSELDPS